LSRSPEKAKELTQLTNEARIAALEERVASLESHQDDTERTVYGVLVADGLDEFLEETLGTDERDVHRAD
jgi:hypothetical protein